MENTINDLLIDDGEREVNPPDDYTGEWKVYWPNGTLKYKALYLKGQTEGEVLCYWDNGTIAQRGTSDLGQCVGVWEDFWEDGGKYKETDYHDSKNFECRWYAANGDLEKVEVWKGGRKVGERTV